MLPVAEGGSSTPNPAAEGTVKPTGKTKKPPAAPSGLTSPVSSAASGSTGSGGAPQPTAPGEDVFSAFNTMNDVVLGLPGLPGKTPDQVLGIEPVVDDLGMKTGALTTVPVPGLPVPYAAGGNSTGNYAPEPLPPVSRKPLKTPEPEASPGYTGGWPDLRMPAYGPQGFPIKQPTLPSYEHVKTEQDRQVREDSLPPARKLRGTGASAGNERSDKVQLDRLTTAEYQALPEDERAAVDFNTMLSQTTTRDKRMQADYRKEINIATDEEKSKYDATVKAMFGSDGGSTTFAPETVALLQQIEFKDPDADLDDFLNMKVAITNDDLKNINFNAPILDPLTPDGTPQQELNVLQSRLALNTEAMAQELTEGDNMLHNVASLARADRNASSMLDYIGGVPKSIKPMLGFGSGPEDLKFQGFFSELVAAGKDAPKLYKDRMSVVEAQTPDYVPLINDYLSRRSFQFERFDIPFGEAGDGFLSPEEFRTALGLNAAPKAEKPKPEPKGAKNGY